MLRRSQWNCDGGFVTQVKSSTKIYTSTLRKVWYDEEV